MIKIVLLRYEIVMFPRLLDEEWGKGGLMIRMIQLSVLLFGLGVCLSAPNAQAVTKKKTGSASNSGARKPATAGRGFKVKISGEFTRVIDEEQGIVCYFAKQGGGSCVNLPR